MTRVGYSSRSLIVLVAVGFATTAFAQAPVIEPLPPFGTRPTELLPPAPVATPAAVAPAVAAPVTNAPPAQDSAAPSAPAPVTPSPAWQSSPSLPNPELQPITFHGIVLGSATTDSVQRIWGAPAKVLRQGSAVQHTYQVAPFERVEVAFLDGKALSIALYLKQVFEPDVLAHQFQLLKLEPVEVTDEHGKSIGISYPERGVALALSPNVAGRQVSRIVFDCIDADPFVMRAEARLTTNLTGSLEDSQIALRLEPTHQHAMVLYCRALERAGRYEDVAEATQKALSTATESVPLYLLQARSQSKLHRYQAALNTVQQALAKVAQQPELHAEALVLLADIIADGPKHDYPLALDYRMQAIQRAEPLLADQRATVRRQAQLVILDAHLGSACDIAQGSWKNKAETVTRWLERAHQLANQGATPDEVAADRIRYCEQALTACAGLNGQLDPQPWVEALTAESRRQQATVQDPLLRSRLNWERGVALADAMQAFQYRGDRDAALAAGGTAVGLIEQVAPLAGPANAEVATLARVYFRLGSIHALANNDHRQATTWYDKAVEQFQRIEESGSPELALAQGESLISMGVSYWSVGQQQRAEELTQRGVQMIESVVADGYFDRQVLAVPYANLAAIHRFLGRDDSARNYAEMAEKSQGGTLR